jgi:hypothetical protein
MERQVRIKSPIFVAFCRSTKTLPDASTNSDGIVSWKPTWNAWDEAWLDHLTHATVHNSLRVKPLFAQCSV